MFSLFLMLLHVVVSNIGILVALFNFSSVKLFLVLFDVLGGKKSMNSVY